MFFRFHFAIVFCSALEADEKCVFMLWGLFLPLVGMDFYVHTYQIFFRAIFYAVEFVFREAWLFFFLIIEHKLIFQ